MPFTMPNYPMLSAEQINPYHAALQTALQGYGQGVQAAYLPQKLQADIASKAAYATYTPYAYLAKALNDPATLYALSKNPEQLKLIMNKLANMPTNPYTSIQSGEMPNAQTGIQQNAAIGAPSSTQMQTQADSGYSYDEYGNNIVMPESEINKKLGGTQTEQGDFSSNVQKNAWAKLFPKSREALDIETQNELWKERSKEHGKSVTDTQNTLTTLDTMRSIYKNLNPYEKGFGWGFAPAFSSNAQKFDQLAKIQSTQNIRALQQGHITNIDFAIGDQIKPNRGLNKEAFESMEDYNKALALRRKQHQKFDAIAKKRGLTIEEADSIWSSFINKYTLFDPETQKLNEENVKIDPVVALSRKSNVLGNALKKEQESNTKIVKESFYDPQIGGIK